MKIIVRLLLPLLFFVSCERALLFEGVVPDDAAEGVVSLTLSAPSGGWGDDLKSRFPGDVESIVSGLSLAIYGYVDDEWELFSQKFYSSFKEVENLTLALNRDYRYRLYVVANLWSGEDEFFSFPRRLSELVDSPFVLGAGTNMTFSDVSSLGIPAAGCCSSDIDFSSGLDVSCSIALKRLFAKIVFSVDRGGYTGDCVDPTDYFSDMNVTISHLNANLYPFPSEGGVMDFTDCGETEYELSCAGTLRSNSYTFYVPANTHTQENSECSLFETGRPADACEPQLTKLVFKGEFKQESGYTGTADYTLYPGASITPYNVGLQWYRDFDLNQGCEYEIILLFTLSNAISTGKLILPSWQIEKHDFEDRRFFGLRWLQSREGGATNLIRASLGGDNTVYGSATQLVVARPSLPAELGLWFSTQGTGGSDFNEFDKAPESRNVGCPVLGSSSSVASALMDNCFYLTLQDSATSASYTFSSVAPSLPDGLGITFDDSSGKLTFSCTQALAGKEYDCKLYFKPGSNVIPFTLRCSEDLSVSLDEIYVGQKKSLGLSGNSGDYSLSCGTDGKLKLSASTSADYLCQAAVAVSDDTQLYAWWADDAVTLTFHPSDPLNDVEFTKTLKVCLPKIHSDGEDIVLPIDGTSKTGPMWYMDNDSNLFSYDDFDAELFANTIAPTATKTTSLSPYRTETIEWETFGLGWFCNTASDFPSKITDGVGKRASGCRADMTPPSAYYPSAGTFSADIFYGIPIIADTWVHPRDTSAFYDSVLAGATVSNTLTPFDACGNTMTYATSGKNCSAAGVGRSGDNTLAWSWKDSGATLDANLNSLNKAPYGPQGVTAVVTNIHDGSTWTNTTDFILYHKFTVNVYAYCAVKEDPTKTEDYETTHFNLSGVYIATPRHWYLMKKNWLNETNFWGSKASAVATISAAGVYLNKYVSISTSTIADEDRFWEKEANGNTSWTRYIKTSLFEPEQGFVYANASGFGVDDIWGDDSSRSSGRRQYTWGRYFSSTTHTEKTSAGADRYYMNYKTWVPVTGGCYSNGTTSLSYNEYINKIQNNYVIINEKSGDLYKNIETVWLGERTSK